MAVIPNSEERNGAETVVDSMLVRRGGDRFAVTFREQVAT